ncbi:hypothetical protein GR702_01390 [Novosphingobium sp. FGD1]|uniref:Putative tail fiber protein gp53-like C-terminal domain-containing protein n=1 Tax=Novosphingobium silvae TaxID=2692619 RepID=A0A7X4K6N4_9SPHN|nr:hypothetical protein [Novosphingobium silvae]MYL96428.1 hypothetical protein [Novosphingobium silvae]
MAALALQLTTAGLAAVTAPDGTAKTVISQLGLTARSFVAAPTLTALPGEFKRLDIASGVAAAPNVAHITAYDTSADVWSANGFGLFLSDGTLFATFSSPQPVLSKAGVAFALMAFDIAFNADVLAEITFSNATFIWPPATEAMRGVARLATQAETDTGTDDQAIVTPRKLKAVRDALFTSLTTSIAAVMAGVTALRGITISGGGLVSGGGNLTADRTLTVSEASAAEIDAGTVGDKVVTPRRLRTVLDNVGSAIDTLRGRTITGGGLVSGGGDLSQSRTLTVTEASAADIVAGTADDKVVTPRRLGPITMVLEENGFLRFFGFQIAWGRFTATANATTNVSFRSDFPTACFSAVVSGVYNPGTGSQDNTPAVIVSTITKAGFSVFSADDENDPTCYIAVGY